MPNTLEVGKKLVELVKAGQFIEAVETLYADDIVSIEAGAPPGGSRQTDGKAAVLAKSRWWVEHHEVHAMTTTGPWPHDDRFIVRYDVDLTPDTGPMAGKRFAMQEAGLYTVKDGKVVREEFFYSMGG